MGEVSHLENHFQVISYLNVELTTIPDDNICNEVSLSDTLWGKLNLDVL
jgi:hypothetical protein